VGLVNFLYRCPDCGHDPLEGEGDEARCPACGVRYRRTGSGVAVLRIGEDGTKRTVPAARLTDAIAAFGGPLTRATTNTGSIAYAANVISRRSGAEQAVWYGSHLLGFSEERGDKRVGRLEVTGQGLTLTHDSGDVERWSFLDLTAVQTSSSSVQISDGRGRIVQFKYPEDSSRRWEELLRTLVARRWLEAGRGEVVEFQPHITVAHGAPVPTGAAEPQAPRPVPVPGPPVGALRAPWYAPLKWTVWGLLHLVARIRVEGRDNIPAQGAFILVSNHQSILDPFLAQSHCPGAVYSMTKSTQFSHPVFRWLMPRVGGFPVRRYRVDPQCVRTTLRLLGEGKAVGIYPEGERSWDGTMMALRGGTVRLLLKAGVPVVPCGIEGSFDVWPRWGGGPRRAEVTLRFGEPLLFGPHDDRASREAALPAAVAGLSRTLRDLSGETERLAGDSA